MNTHVEESMSQKVQKTLRFILLCVLFVIFVFSFVLVIINVFKTKADINTAPLALIGSHGFSLDNEYSTFSVLMGERNLPSEYSRHRFCFTRTGRFYLPEVTGRPLRK